MGNHHCDEFRINDINIDFVEQMLKSLPSNIYFKDEEGRYVFCTHYWDHINHTGDPDWTIRGKYDIDIRTDRANALRAMEEDQKILTTGKGASYEIRQIVDGKPQYLQLIKNPVFDGNGHVIGIVGLINDITQMKVLELKLEKMATEDILTGLRSRAYLPIWLETMREKDILPLAVIAVDSNGLKKVNDLYGHIAGDRYIKEAARALKNALPENAQVIRMGGDEFLALLPKCGQQGAEAYMQSVKKLLSQRDVDGLPVTLSMGAAVCEEAGFRIEDYIRIADGAMYIEKARFHAQKGNAE